MKEVAINIKAQNKPGVLRDITDMIAKSGINISYTHLFIEKDGCASVYMELEDADDIQDLVKNINIHENVDNVKIHRSLSEIYGKRIIIIGGGA